MSLLKSLSLLLIVLVLGGAGYWLLSRPASQTPEALSTTPKKNNKLQQLAQHHCNKLNSSTDVQSCVNQLLQDQQEGKLAPQKPEFNPNACANVYDPKEQHTCHGWLTHDFAVSTGDIKRCDIIPLPDIKASCQQAIIINEVKSLYTLENNSAAGSH